MTLMLCMIILDLAVLVYLQIEKSVILDQPEESQSDTGTVAVPSEGKQAGRALFVLGGIVSNFSGEVPASHKPVKSPENRRPVKRKQPGLRREENQTRRKMKSMKNHKMATSTKPNSAIVTQSSTLRMWKCLSCGEFLPV